MSAPIETRVAELEAQVKELISKYEEMLNNKRDRGPASEREMTEEDAFKIKFGELKSMKHKEAAEKLGLSYGQIYSARGGYTFKQVKEDWKPSKQAQQQ
jgi:hypothetical protein